MEINAFLAALDRDSGAFADACEAAGLTAPVESCPGWSVADLLWHLTEVHYFWGTMVAEKRDSWQGYKEPQRPADDDLAAMFRNGRTRLLATLRVADPTMPMWTWSQDKTAGFVIRRMAQETAVHLWDAKAAGGTVVPIEATLASDGIDEFLEHFLPNARKDAAPVAGSVHIHCGDVPGEWTVTEESDGFAIAREHAKGDCAIRGAANDILLTLWRRVPISQVDIVGDQAVAERFIAHTSLD
jgi:uncharacterized protein (TIGR03083 family)